jgi:hypothetical protein
MKMKEIDIIEKTGMSKAVIKGYREYCNVEKGGSDWSDSALKKLEEFLELPKGTLVVEFVPRPAEFEMVICRIFPNPNIVGIKQVDGSGAIQRCRMPVQRLKRLGMKILARNIEGDLWRYVGMAKR